MQSVPTSKKRIPSRDYKKTNVAIKQPKSIIDLVKKIPKEVDVMSASDFGYSDLLRIAEHCAKYIKKYNPLLYKTISFEEKDTIFKVISTLLRNIKENNLAENVFYDKEKKETGFLECLDFNEVLYVIETKYLNIINNKQLKIGYAHLLEKLNTIITNSFLDRNDDIFSPIVEMYETDDEANDEELDFLEEHKQTIESSLKLYDKYRKELIDVFFDFKPKHKRDIDLHICLSNLLNMDFKKVFDVRPLLSFENEEVCFSNIFFILEDFKAPVQSEYFDCESTSITEYGINPPSCFIKIKGNKIIDERKEQREMFSNFTKELTNLIIILDQNY